jgi:hypothetical protein
MWAPRQAVNLALLLTDSLEICVQHLFSEGGRNLIFCLRFQVLTAASMKFRVFCDVLPCSQINVDRRFRDACCLRHSPDDGGNTHL